MQFTSAARRPKVSVVVPVYNVEPWIERCARSLFGQTLDDMEFIFVDDCTPDNSVAVIERVLEDYPIRKCQTHIIHQSNQGPLMARTCGQLLATGELVGGGRFGRLG